MSFLIVLLGPTASGKTLLGIELAKKYNGIVISADSRQIYRELDIGTAKPYVDLEKPDAVRHFLSSFKRPQSLSDAVAVDGIPHYAVDIVDPDEEYSVAQYQDDAMTLIEKAHQEKQTPFLVGGTGLYIQAVVDQLTISRVPADWALRNQLEQRIATEGIESVYQELIRRDPAAAGVVQEKNPRRVIRALEVTLKTGIPFTEHRKIGKPPFDVLQIGIRMSISALDERIDARVHAMIEAGFLDEVQRVSKKYDWSLPSLSGQGYHEFGAHLRGEMSFDEAVTRTKRATRQYARRQMTWFKRDRRIQWIEHGQQAQEILDRFVLENKNTPM